MLRVKPSGYFQDRNDAGRLSRFLRYGLPDDPHIPMPGLSGPGAVTDWTVERVNDDQYVIRIRSFPHLGDRLIRGDGLGEIIRTEWAVNGGEWSDLGMVTPDERVVTAISAATLSVRLVASAGTGPVSTLSIGTVAPNLPNLLLITNNDDDDLVTEDGGQILLYLGAPPVEVPGPPSAFLPGQWGVEDAGTGGALTLTILSTPSSSSPITGLQYSLDGGFTALSLSGSGIGARIIAAPDGVIATVVIRALNDNGEGPWSAPKAAIPSAAPRPFTDAQWSLTDAGTGGTLVLTVLGLPEQGASAITGIEYSTDAGETFASLGVGTGARLLTGLTDDAPVSVIIRARNAIGAGEWSPVKTEIPTAPPVASDPPDAFTGGQWALADAATGGALTLSITALPAANDEPISALYYRIGTGSPVALPGAGTGSYAIAGLTNGVSVNVQIAAASAAGLADWSDTKAGTPTGVVLPDSPPAAFTAGQWALADNASSGTLRLNLASLPAPGDQPITTIYYRVGGGAAVVLPGGIGTGDHFISGLSNGVSASIQIAASSSAGTAPWSDTKSATPTAPVGGGGSIGSAVIGSTLIVG